MSRVFYLPPHRTTSHPLALGCMPSTGWWFSADERQYWKKYWRSPSRSRLWTTAFSAAGRHSTTRPLVTDLSKVVAELVCGWLIQTPTQLPICWLVPSHLKDKYIKKSWHDTATFADYRSENGSENLMCLTFDWQTCFLQINTLATHSAAHTAIMLSLVFEIVNSCLVIFTKILNKMKVGRVSAPLLHFQKPFWGHFWLHPWFWGQPLQINLRHFLPHAIHNH